MKISTINHQIVHILLAEGADYICNGDFYKSHRTLVDELKISNKEAWEILYSCPLYKNVDYAIKAQLDELNGINPYPLST